jgi:hypothetical protein
MKREKSAKQDDRTEEDILYELLSKKTKAIDPNKVFWIGVAGDGVTVAMKLAGKKLPDNVASQLRNEAQMLSKMTLWKILTETLRHTAHQQMFEQMKTLEDSHYGKTMLFNVGVQERIVKGLCDIEKYKQPPRIYSQRPTPTELSTT